MVGFAASLNVRHIGRRCAAAGPTIRAAATALSLVAALAGCQSIAGTESAPPTTWDNSIGMRFVRLPAGDFMMGSDEAPADYQRDYPQLEPSRFSQLGDEAPVHRVRITRAFWLGQHEVTVGQFRRFLALSSYVPESIADGTGGYGYDALRARTPVVEGDAFAGRDPRYSWRDPGFPQDDTHPVVNVTWNDAVAMAAWLSRHEGRRYRLPTEAEWEYACHAGSRTRYATGDAPASLQGQANLFDQDSAANWPRWAAQALPFHDGWAFTAPVGSLAANAFGIHDLHGNVWEWVSDRHADDYYQHSPVDDPPGPAEGNLRVRRGGSWHTWPFYARCSFRNWNSPSTRYTLVGFRLMLQAEEAPSPDESKP